MSGQDQPQERSEHDPQHLRITLDGLEHQDAALREACAFTVERAIGLRSSGARIRAHARALRSSVLRVRLARDPSCGAIARRLVAEYLDGRPDRVVSDAKAVVSELVNNACRHGEGTIELRVARHRSWMRIDVVDDGPAGAAAQLAEGRRGLEIVNALSLRWGAYAGSTHVWAELAIGPERVGPSNPGAMRDVDG